MKVILSLILGLLLGAGGYWLLQHSSAHDPKEEPGPVEEPHGGPLKLTEEQQSAAGIQLAQPQPAVVPATVKGYGRVLDPAPIISLKLEADAARAALGASSKEFDRVQGLFARNQNASARALETAEAAVLRDRALLSAAEARFQSSLGPRVSAMDTLSNLMTELANFRWTLARLDVPGPVPPKLETSLQVWPLANEKLKVAAELLGAAPAAETALQGQGFLCLMRTNLLTPNTAIAGFLEDAAESKKGFLIPASAVVQERGALFVFVLAGGAGGTFEKKEVKIEREIAGDVFITAGLSATSKVVVAGAHQILSMTKAEPSE
jgi:hypothetical protein